MASSTAAVSAESSETTARPRPATTSSGVALPGEHPVDDLAGQLVRQRARRSTSAITRATCAGVIGSSASVDARVVGLLGQLAHPPRAGGSAGAPASTVSTTRSSASALTRSRMLLVGDAPLGLDAARAAPTAAPAAPPRSSSTHSAPARSAPGRARGSSGSPRRSPSRGPARWCRLSSSKCRVSWMIVPPAASTRRVPADLVADRPLDRAQRVDVLGLGAGAELRRALRASARRSRRSASSPGPCARRRRRALDDSRAAPTRRRGPPRGARAGTLDRLGDDLDRAGRRPGCSRAASSPRRGCARWRRRCAATCRCPPPCGRARSPTRHGSRRRPRRPGSRRSDRLVVLGDLEVLRHVRIEVVLPGEPAPLGDLAVEGQADAGSRTPPRGRSPAAASPAARGTPGRPGCWARRRTRCGSRRTSSSRC